MILSSRGVTLDDKKSTFSRSSLQLTNLLVYFFCNPNSNPVPMSFSTSSVPRKSKNPGLAIALNLGELPSQCTISRRPSSVNSLANTPELEPDWHDEDMPEEEDENVQYVFIDADSPFYNGPASRHPYLSVNAFPFACAALAEDDSLFAEFPDSPLEDELESKVDDNGRVVIVDLDDIKDFDTQVFSEWSAEDSSDQLKRPRAVQTFDIRYPEL